VISGERPAKKTIPRLRAREAPSQPRGREPRRGHPPGTAA
jgi:hypothetical protein